MLVPSYLVVVPKESFFYKVDILERVRSIHLAAREATSAYALSEVSSGYGRGDPPRSDKIGEICNPQKKMTEGLSSRHEEIRQSEYDQVALLIGRGDLQQTLSQLNKESKMQKKRGLSRHSHTPLHGKSGLSSQVHANLQSFDGRGSPRKGSP